MRTKILPMILVLAATPAAALELRSGACEVRSDYRWSIDDDRIRLFRGDGSPQEVVLASGVLRIDGEVVPLAAADAVRVRDYERRVRRLVPEARAIAHDAVDIAVDAIGAVARAFAPDGASGDAAAAFEASASRLHRQVDAAFASGSFDDSGFAAAMKELVPQLVAGVTAQAVKVALSGDEAAARRLEARSESLDAEIERAVEARAKALERRADALCGGVAALDALERDWGVSHAGAPLDLVEVTRRD